MKRILAILCILGMIILSAASAVGQNTFVGHVFYHNNPEYPLPEVDVELYDEDGNLVETYFTDEDGLFQFDDVPDGEYTIKATTELPVGNITMQHALNIIFYLNGMMQFTPYQLMAADVNGNGVVNMNDFLYIIIEYFVHGNSFPAGEWQFEDLLVSTFSRDGEDTLSSGGTKTGETVGVWLPTGRDLIEELSLTPDGSIYAESNETFSFPLFIDNNTDLNGYLMVLDYDATAFELINMTPINENVAVSVKNGQVRFSWANTDFRDPAEMPEVLADFTFLARTTSSGYSGSVFQLNPESHFVDRNGQIANFTKLFAPNVVFNPTIFEEQFVVSPNPATTFVQLKLGNEAQVLDVKMYNMTGQLIKHWPADAFASDASYYVGDLLPGMYQLVAVDNSSSKKTYHNRLLIQ